MSMAQEKRDAIMLTTTTNATDLIPDDVYTESAFLAALYSSRKLAGVVSYINEDISAEDGDAVKVPYIDRRTLPAAVSPGATVTAADTTMGVYNIAITKYGDRDTIQREVLEDNAAFEMADFLNNMAEAIAEKVDQLVYDELETATAGGTTALATAGTLTDLYDKIVEGAAAMKKRKANPTHLILGPDQEAQLLKDASEGVRFTQIQTQAGRVTMVAGLTVVCTPLANANTATLNEVQAVIVDKARALGEVWGRPPDFPMEYLNTSDVFEVVSWFRYGAAELDTDAIEHVVNPAA